MAMMNDRRFRAIALTAIPALLIFPVSLFGQQLAREALSSFPMDTYQITFSSLAQLRSLPDYPKIRQRMFNQQLSNLQEFLRAMGTDPDRDVDEAMLGWRGDPANSNGFFGMATGRFQTDRIRDTFVRNRLPIRQYQGMDLYAYGSGEDVSGLFFTFLSSSQAAFGRLSDLKTILDVRAREQVALDSKQLFVNGEAELEGTAPQWGMATGKAAVNLAGPWLTSGGRLPVEASAFAGNIQAVLYRVEWDSNFTARLSILCQNEQSAAALTQVLNFLRSASTLSNPGSSTNVASLLRDMDIQANESRVDLRASGPIETLDQVFRSSNQPTTPSPSSQAP